MAVMSLECRFECTNNDAYQRVRTALESKPLSYKFRTDSLATRPKAEVSIQRQEGFIVVNFRMVADGARAKNPNFNTQAKIIEKALDISNVEIQPVTLNPPQEFLAIAERLIAEYLEKVCSFERGITELTNNLQFSKGRLLIELEVTEDGIVVYPYICGGKGKPPDVSVTINAIRVLVEQLY